MKPSLLLSLVIGSLVIGGCSSSPEDDATAKDGSGQVTNPGGKPKTEADGARSSQMQSQGQQMNAQASKDAQAMREAMQRSGGK